jgi:hypothetical protein
MKTGDEKRLKIATAGVFISILVCSSVAITLALTKRKSPDVTFALCFGISLVCTLISAAVMFIRTERKQVWRRIVEAEVSLRALRGLNTETARRVAESRWLILFAMIFLTAFLILAVLSGILLFKQKHF